MRRRKPVLPANAEFPFGHEGAGFANFYLPDEMPPPIDDDLPSPWQTPEEIAVWRRWNAGNRYHAARKAWDVGYRNADPFELARIGAQVPDPRWVHGEGWVYDYDRAGGA